MFIFPKHAGAYRKETIFMNRMVLKIIIAIFQSVAILLALLL